MTVVGITGASGALGRVITDYVLRSRVRNLDGDHRDGAEQRLCSED